MPAPRTSAAARVASVPLLLTGLLGATLPTDPPPVDPTATPPSDPVVTAPADPVPPPPVIPPPAVRPGKLPLGKPDLVEKRTEQNLAEGVTLTKIHRGKGKAKAKRIARTRSGPWNVNVLTIDPAIAQGRLEATYGPDLARTERTTALTRRADALAGVNASYFTFTKNRTYPGDPVGLGLYDGRLLSEPTGRYAETAVLIDANTGLLQVGPLRWTGSVRNQVTGVTVSLTSINHAPAVPGGCGRTAKPGRCRGAGEAVRFTPDFGRKTAKGSGVEVVLDAAGCVVRTEESRGTTLLADQTSVQGTGLTAAAVRQVALLGCVQQDEVLTDRLGQPVELQPDLYGVAARYPLVTGGARVSQPGGGGYSGRNPRTIVGTDAAGRILLVTIDGKRRTSVGTTLTETAKVAKSLGMREAVNLDGGGSTTMSVRGKLANTPSGNNERAIGDALVFVPSTEPPAAPTLR